MTDDATTDDALTDAAPTEEVAQPDLIAALPASPLHERMGIRITAATAQRVVGTMPVEGNTQPYGLLHGGASLVLAEGLGSIASALYAGADRTAVGVDISATHHRAVRSGVVTGTATPLHLGSTVATYQIVLTDEHDRRICTARLTCLLRARSG